MTNIFTRLHYILNSLHINFIYKPKEIHHIVFLNNLFWKEEKCNFFDHGPFLIYKAIQAHISPLLLPDLHSCGISVKICVEKRKKFYIYIYIFHSCASPVRLCWFYLHWFLLNDLLTKSKVQALNLSFLNYR